MKRILRNKIIAAVSMSLGALTIASPARAMTTSVDFSSNTSANGLASFSGHAIYDDVSHVLTLVVQNTTAAAKGGYLTGLAFNAANTQGIYKDGDNAMTPKADEDAFDNARKGKKLIKIKKVGSYASGAALDGKLGKANRKGAVRGVRAGGAQSFSFVLSGAGAGSMTAGDLFGGQGGLVAAFSAINGKKTDMVTGKLAPAQMIDNTNANPGTPTTVTPGGEASASAGSSTGGGVIGTGTNGRPVIPGVVVPPANIGSSANTGTGTGTGTGIGTLPGIVLPPLVVDTGGSTGGSVGGPGAVSAVPLPPAAWTGLAGLVMVGVAKARQRFKA